jgi:hypothetical protein
MTKAAPSHARPQRPRETLPVSTSKAVELVQRTWAATTQGELAHELFLPR